MDIVWWLSARYDDYVIAYTCVVNGIAICLVNIEHNMPLQFKLNLDYVIVIDFQVY